ncbi:unnamed protein product [Danaus chrysippus]|uniref:(African queen) hypothetical protein n=1 Tax=Danaus chrysippus TaxID=151541 RepID=A0A8J2QRC7_9NEOP|nr:unnamed protein product [Danaus chrysippus]
MFLIKLLLISVLLVLSDTHDIFLGYPDMASKVIYSKVHQENPAIWVRSDTFTVNCSSSDVINAVKVLDLREDKSGEAYVKGGGIGQNHVTIELDSPSIFRGYNFLVQVYAIHANNFLFRHGK